MSDLSEEMQREIIGDLHSDIARFQTFLQKNNFSTSVQYSGLDYTTLEQLVYITEQIRLKLKMLGAPRICQ